MSDFGHADRLAIFQVGYANMAALACIVRALEHRGALDRAVVHTFALGAVSTAGSQPVAHDLLEVFVQMMDVSSA